MAGAGRSLVASFFILSSVLLFLLPTTMVPTAQAPSLNISQVHRTFWLNGTINPGPAWNNSLPGPPLIVTSGDRVTLMLKSADNTLHQWYIDFNNNSHLDSNEIFVSPDIYFGSYVNYTFTPVIGANVTSAGTYAYRCAFHPTMVGPITINQPPPSQLSASFTMSPASPVQGQTITFTPVVTGGTPPYRYSWNFSDGTPNATTQSPTHIYISPGIFAVQLVVTDSGSPEQISTSTLSVIVSALPPQPPTITLVRVSPNPTFPGEQTLIDFTATYAGGPVTATWIDWGDQTTPDLLLNMTATDMCAKLNFGDTHSTSCAMPPGTVILARPQDPATIVIGSIVVFRVPSTPNIFRVHRVIGILPPNATNPDYLFKTQADYYTFSDCWTPTCYIPASWISAVYQSTPLAPGTFVCIPENPCPTGGTGARYDYHAYGNLGPSQSQTFTVSVNATDFDGTNAETTTFEKVNDRPPSVSIANPSPSTITAGSTTTITFSATDPDGTISSITINWGDGSTSYALPGTTRSQTHKYTTSGTFTISIFAIDNSGSTSSAATSTVEVSPQPSPTAQAPRILGLDPTLFYFLVAVGLAAVAATVIGLRTRRPQT